MSDPYKRIVELKPIIEGSPKLVERLKACFDYTQNPEDTKKPNGLIEDVDNSMRFIFNGLYVNNDFMILKTFKPPHDRTDTFSYFVEEDERRIKGSLLCREIGTLEKEGDLSVLGVVYHYPSSLAGILMEDISQGGKYKLKPESEKGQLGGDYLLVLDGEKVIRREISDVKRDSPFFNFEEGLKYFSPEARIELH